MWAAQKDERRSFPWRFELRHSLEGCFGLLWPLFKHRKPLMNVLEKPCVLIFSENCVEELVRPKLSCFLWQRFVLRCCSKRLCFPNRTPTFCLVLNPLCFFSQTWLNLKRKNTCCEVSLRFYSSRQPFLTRISSTIQQNPLSYSPKPQKHPFLCVWISNPYCISLIESIHQNSLQGDFSGLDRYETLSEAAESIEALFNVWEGFLTHLTPEIRCTAQQICNGLKKSHVSIPGLLKIKSQSKQRTNTPKRSQEVQKKSTPLEEAGLEVGVSTLFHSLGFHFCSNESSWFFQNVYQSFSRLEKWSKQLKTTFRTVA